jgi:hypothetical protein
VGVGEGWGFVEKPKKKDKKLNMYFEQFLACFVWV